MRLYIFMVLFWLVSGWVQAQDSLLYEGPAIWNKNSDGFEKFEYITDSIQMIPHGAYEFKYMEREKGTSNYLLHEFNAKMNMGVPDGIFNFWTHQISFQIIDFDSIGVESKITGRTVRLTGDIRDGKARETWKYSVVERTKESDSIEMYFHTEKNEWAGILDGWKFSGHIDEYGRMTDTWHWQHQDVGNIEFLYFGGVLIGIMKEGEMLYADFFEGSEKLPNKEMDWVYSEYGEGFMWLPADEQQHFLGVIQRPFAAVLSSAFRPHIEAKAFLDSLVNGVFPPLPRVALQVHHLNKDSLQLFEVNLSRLKDLDANINNTINQAIFQLRRTTSFVCDSLLCVMEEKLEKHEIYFTEVQSFLNHESRVICPGFYCVGNYCGFMSHDDILMHFSALGAEYSLQSEQILSLSDSLRNILTIESSLELLEEEWLMLKSKLREIRAADVLSDSETKVYDMLIRKTFDKEREQYGQFQTQFDRQDYLLNRLEAYRFFLEFFEKHSLIALERAPEIIIEAYTDQLYNPFTGDYNVEALRKRRFVKKIENSFWEGNIERLTRIKNQEEFINEYHSVKKMKSRLIEFKERRDRQARSIEKNFIKAKSWEEMHQTLMPLLN
jgi:hypothetical protein